MVAWHIPVYGSHDNALLANGLQCCVSFCTSTISTLNSISSVITQTLACLPVSRRPSLLGRSAAPLHPARLQEIDVRIAGLAFKLNPGTERVSAVPEHR